MRFGSDYTNPVTYSYISVKQTAWLSVFKSQHYIVAVSRVTYLHDPVILLGPLHTELVLAGGLRVNSVTSVKSCESVVNSSDRLVVSENFKNLLQTMVVYICTAIYVATQLHIVM